MSDTTKSMTARMASGTARHGNEIVVDFSSTGGGRYTRGQVLASVETHLQQAARQRDSLEGARKNLKEQQAPRQRGIGESNINDFIHTTTLERTESNRMRSSLASADMLIDQTRGKISDAEYNKLRKKYGFDAR